jgi:hypothetical protein
MGDSIDVDTDGLKSFADNVGFYATEVDPQDVSRSKQQFADGVTFGVNNASGSVYVAKTNYAEALTLSLANLTEFVKAAKILADAAEETAKDFQAVDGRSAEAVEAVNRKLADATQRASFIGPQVPKGAL